MIFASTTKPKVDDAPVKLRHILADQVKPKVFDFDRNRYKEMNPKRKPGGPITTSHLGDIEGMKKRAAAAAERDAIRAKTQDMPQKAPAVAVAGISPTPQRKRAGKPKKAK